MLEWCKVTSSDNTSVEGRMLGCQIEDVQIEALLKGKWLAQMSSGFLLPVVLN